MPSNMFNVASFAAPLQRQQQTQAINALAQAIPTFSQMGVPQEVQYNALAEHGGPTRAAAGQARSYVANKDMGAQIYQGLVQRGLPPHVAEGFVLNMQDESGLNPGINEAKPLVPGSRGGFGLYQLTGPRRRAYEAFAQQRGAPLDDVDAQLDFLMMEMQGPEARAAKSILAAGGPGEAAAAIVTDFLRPSPEHRDRRKGRYLQYQGGAIPTTSGAPADMESLLADLGL